MSSEQLLPLSPASMPPMRCVSCDLPLRGSVAPDGDRRVAAISCGHTLCVSCAEALVSADVPMCPYCNATISKRVTVNVGLSMLAEEAFLAGQKEAELSQSTFVCFECSALDDIDTPAVYKCMVCIERPLCEVHGPAHAQLRSHAINRLGVAVSSVAGTAGRCITHPGCDLNFFCVTDGTPVCRDCLALSHPRGEHEILELAAAADKLAATLTERKAAYSNFITECDKHAEVMQEVKSGLARAHTAAVGEFTTAVDSVQAALVSRKKTALAAAESKLGSRMKVLNSQQDGLFVSAGQAAAAVTMCEASVASGSALRMASAVSGCKQVDPLLGMQFDGPRTTADFAINCNTAAVLDAVNRHFGDVVEVLIVSGHTDANVPFCEVVGIACSG